MTRNVQGYEGDGPDSIDCAAQRAARSDQFGPSKLLVILPSRYQLSIALNGQSFVSKWCGVQLPLTIFHPAQVPYSPSYKHHITYLPAYYLLTKKERERSIIDQSVANASGNGWTRHGQG